MNKKYMFALFFIVFSILTGCSDQFDNEEEIVLVDQPKEEEKYPN